MFPSRLFLSRVWAGAEGSPIASSPGGPLARSSDASGVLNWVYPRELFPPFPTCLGLAPSRAFAKQKIRFCSKDLSLDFYDAPKLINGSVRSVLDWKKHPLLAEPLDSSHCFQSCPISQLQEPKMSGRNLSFFFRWVEGGADNHFL